MAVSFDNKRIKGENEEEAKTINFTSMVDVYLSEYASDPKLLR